MKNSLKDLDYKIYVKSAESIATSGFMCNSIIKHSRKNGVQDYRYMDNFIELFRPPGVDEGDSWLEDFRDPKEQQIRELTLLLMAEIVKDARVKK